MSKKFKFEGNEYDVDQLSKTGKEKFERLRGIDLTISEKKNLLAFLLRAKKAYMSDLKSEMLSQKAGFDFSD
tara:strand:+ start:339 stop:554 length:216 start_codon:yes stop_codon:yes gene_type:complete